MTLTRATRVECDQCGAAATVTLPRRKAARWLRANGWDIHAYSTADLCPLCDGSVEVSETRCQCGAHVTYDAASRLAIRCVCGRGVATR